MRSRTIIGISGLIGLLMVTSVILASAPVETSSTAWQQPEPTLDPFPRPTDWEIIVAEQVFENGRMFYLAPNARIWVMVDDDSEATTGTWQVYADSWQEGEPDRDPALRPPDGMHQPIRGFGKLWRENETIRDALGWALDPEFGHLSRYQFHAGELMETDEGTVPHPGFHMLTSYYGHTFVFDEGEMTWSVMETETDDEEMTEAEEAADATETP